LNDCDHVLHAGDIGNHTVMDQLIAQTKTDAVYGNIDDAATRVRYPEHLRLNIEGVHILMIHIAGAIERYNQKTRALIEEHRPDVLICGHSHILKVKQDQRFGLLHINPGAAGRHGFHKVRTLLTVEVANGQLSDLKLVELGPRSIKST
jgi:putative phosphoesterase